MLKLLYRPLLLSTGILFALPTCLIKPSLAQAPSLGDGILCVAKGKTSQGNRLYLYTSVIDNDSIKQKQPVSVTINQPMVTIEGEEVVVVDSSKNTIAILDAATATPPEMQPVGLASTTYQGNNTFSGKTNAGTPVSFTLANNFTLKLKAFMLLNFSIQLTLKRYENSSNLSSINLLFDRYF